MLNQTIITKVKERLNKLDSGDYDNIQDWQILEAYNLGVPLWCRRQLQGTNLSKTGDEASKRRIDDLQVLLPPEPVPINMVKKDGYYLSSPLFPDYFEWKRLSPKATHGCCKEPRPMKVWLVEEENIDVILGDRDKKPNFAWGETIATLAGNRIKLYTNNEFDVVEAKLMYYKQPRRIEVSGVRNIYTGAISTVDVLSEFKDDIIELHIFECVKILTGDIESMNVNQIADNSVETNN